MKALGYIFLLVVSIKAYATPKDSLLNKLADEFANFIAKNHQQTKSTKNNIFYFDEIKPDNGNNYTYHEYQYGGTSLVDDLTTSPYYTTPHRIEQTYEVLNEFNQTYDNGNFAFYVFHGRFYAGFRSYGVIYNLDQDYSNASANGLSQIAISLNNQGKNTIANYATLPDRLHEKLKNKPNTPKRIFILYFIQYYSFVDTDKDGKPVKDFEKTKVYLSTDIFWDFNSWDTLNPEEKEIISITSTGDIANTFSNDNNTNNLLINQFVKRYRDSFTFIKHRGEILSNSTSNSDLIKLLNSFSTYQFSLLTWQERVAILSRFSKSAMTEQWLWGLVGNNTENIAIKVLATAPQEQYGDIIHYFEMSDANLLQNLVYRIDGDNFASLISYLSQYTYYQRSQPLLNESNVSQYIKNQRFLGFDDWKALPYEAGKYSRIDFAVRKNFHWNYQYELKDIDAFQYVLIRFDDDFSTGQGNYYPKGHIDFIPAIALYGLYNESANRKIRLFVDGLGFASGVAGMVRQSGEALTLALLDMGIAVTDITLSLVLVDELNKTEEGKEVLLYWNRFAMVYMGGRMSGLVLTHGQRFYHSAKKYLSKRQDAELKKIIDDLEAKEPEVKNTPPVEVQGAGRQSWNGFANIFKANADEVLEATNKIKNHRIIQNAGTSGNYGYLEGKVGNINKNGEMIRSGAPDDNVTEVFEALHVNSQQVIQPGEINGAWLRNTDSEYKMLNRLANELNAVKGGKYPNVTGELKIVSERAYCPSCQGVIQQFNEMFPNVKLILVDGAK